MRDWLDSTVRCMADGVIVTDAQGSVRLLNPVAEALTGWSREQALGIEWSRVFDVVDRRTGQPMDHLAAEALHDGSPVELGRDCMLLERNGAQKPVEGTFSLMHDLDGNFAGWVLIFRDVTEQRYAEAALRQCNEDVQSWAETDLLDRLTRGLAHDFGHLLTAMLGNLSIVLGDMVEKDRNREYLLKVEKLGLRAGEMVTQLVEFSRRKQKPCDVVDLNDVVASIVDCLCCLVHPRLDIRFTPSEGPWPIFGDAGHVKEVVFNLCLNARDAMPNGGELLLQVENVVLEGADEGTARPRGEFVCLHVIDSGEGMLPEVKARIFEPFFTTKKPRNGAGLGLNLMATIVEQHGGWMEFASELGQGSRFDVYFPRHVA